MISADDFQALQRRAEAARAARDKAEGAAAALLERMKTEFGVNTPAEAERELARLEREQDELAEEYLAAKRDFEERYRDELK